MVDPGTGTILEAAYGDGWDPRARRVVRPITAEQARRRDAVGEPYSVVLTAPGQDIPEALLHVAWNRHYLGLWWLDEYGRRKEEIDLRSLEDGKLFLRHLAQWRYDSPDVPEFADTAWHQAVDLYPDGKGRRVVQPNGRLGGSTHTVPTIPMNQRWLPRTDFGHWAALLSAPHFGVHGPYRIREASQPTVEEPSAETGRPSGWRPPEPGSEPWLNELFTEGFLFAHERGPNPVAIEPVRTVATYTVTSGLIALCDPAYLPRGVEGDPLVVAVPPGRYPLQETGVSYPAEMFGDTFTMRDDYAIRLLINPAPTVSWTMAVPPGDDIRLLRDGARYGFGVDSGTGCFVDPDHRGELGQRFLDGDFTPDDAHPDAPNAGYLKTADPTTGAELLAFPTGGDGVFTVWIGRDAQGDVTALVIPAPFQLIGVKPYTVEFTP